MARQGLRTLDYVYLVFFAIHIPIIIFVDTGGLYPEGYLPSFNKSIREFYVGSFNDQYFVDPPRWFIAFTIMEVIYHLPVSIWMLTAIMEGHPLVPLHQLIFAVQTAVTTLVCMVEVFSFAYTRMEEIKLSALYSTYLLLAVVMGIDSFSRLRNVIDSRPKVKSV